MVESQGNFESKSSKEKLIGTIFLTSVAGASALGGFSYAVVASKKQSPNSFAKGLENGATLGLRALAWGSLFAVGGVGLLTFGVCKLLGIHNLSEFRTRTENALKRKIPRVKEANPPGRREFASFRELFDYLSTTTPSKEQSDSVKKDD